MKIYLAGTPGIESRERVAKDFEKKAAFLLGHSAESICYSFCFQFDQGKK